jgi:diguanylate cyclase (GGDEF)-like protein/PAS domain S-box-containing protein
MKVPIPANEVDRLKVLQDLQLLDTEPEMELDQLTKLTAQICNTPIALISLIDKEREWFKSNVGFNAKETSRDVAFSAHAIVNPDKIMEVEDTQNDSRFKDNSLVVKDPKIRFYAGAPIVTSNGFCLGTLCVLDYEPRKLSENQRYALYLLSEFVVRHIELRETLRNLTKSEGLLSDKTVSLKSKVNQVTVSLEKEIGMRIESELFSRRILDMSFDAVITTNKSGEVLNWNPRAEEILGYTSEYTKNKPLLELIVEPKQRTSIRAEMDRIIEENGHGYGKGNGRFKHDRIKMNVIRSDGQRVPADVYLISFPRIKEYIFTFFIKDLTEWNSQIEELKLSAVTFNSQEGTIITDGDLNVLRVNSAFMKITGFNEEDVIGKMPDLLNSDQHDRNFYKKIFKSLEKSDGWEGEVSSKCKNGEIIPLHLSITAIHKVSGEVSHYVIGFSDITKSKQDADEIYSLAFFDPLTGLPNRRLLMDRLNQAVGMGARSGQMAALLFIDLDNFKSLNDSLGHEYGDVMLVQVAERLRSCLRIEDSVARIGGDEFVVILQNIAEDAPAQTEVVARKILTSLSRPYFLKDHEYFSSASIGATLFNSHGSNADDLLKQADLAMYQAKKLGRNMLRFFDPQMQENIAQRVKLENALHIALVNHQFQLYYQAQVNGSNKVIGAEALIRWEHPKLGVISPDDFIPLAEESGLILSVGYWVLESACAQLKKWQANSQTSAMTLSINISPRQFHQADFVAVVLKCISKAGIDPKLIKLELTERILLEGLEEALGEDMEEATIKMGELKAAGVRFALDDFGTGFSSMSYLTKLPLSQLKIDQSFVQNIGFRESDDIIVKTIIGMSKSLGLEVVAEGVESQVQYDYLEALGCQIFQGYFFGRPLPIAEFNRLLNSPKNL